MLSLTNRPANLCLKWRTVSPSSFPQTTGFPGLVQRRCRLQLHWMVWIWRVASQKPRSLSFNPPTILPRPSPLLSCPVKLCFSRPLDHRPCHSPTKTNSVPLLLCPNLPIPLLPPCHLRLIAIFKSFSNSRPVQPILLDPPGERCFLHHSPAPS